jgi:hypothetical protein
VRDLACGSTDGWVAAGRAIYARQVVSEVPDKHRLGFGRGANVLASLKLSCLATSVTGRPCPGKRPKRQRKEVKHVEYSWNVMAHGDAREGKWRGNWRMEWVASTHRGSHTTSEHGVSSFTNADAHASAARSRLNWRPRRFKWTRPFRRKTNSGFCACAITFQTQSTYSDYWFDSTFSLWFILYIQITEVSNISWWAVSTLSMLKWNYYTSKTKSNNSACSQHRRS